MAFTYATILSSERYLAGVLVLDHSLKRVKSKAALLVLAAAALPEHVFRTLADLHIETRKLDLVCEPPHPRPAGRYGSNCNKLQAFGLTHYRKVVYLDADMLVCHNIDDLFARDHGSAVNAGGLLSQVHHWIDYDSGLLVLEPADAAREAFSGKTPPLSAGDAPEGAFLPWYFPEWYERKNLHLDLGYNLCVGHLDRYCQLYDYRFTEDNAGRDGATIKAVHFKGNVKPWEATGYQDFTGQYGKAFRLWHACLSELLEGQSSLNRSYGRYALRT